PRPASPPLDADRPAADLPSFPTRRSSDLSIGRQTAEPPRGTGGGERMKISELSAATEVPVGTIKYYLREGLLHPGERTSRTTARYDHGHVERIRLVRALTDAGGLGIAQIKRGRDGLAAAQDALVDGGASVDGEGRADREDPADGPPSNQAVLDGPPSNQAVLDGPPSDRARAWAERRGWFSYDGDHVISRFARAWAA